MSLLVAGAVFAVATGMVVLVAPRMTRVTEVLSDRTPLGSALFGAIFLGASTSLPGIVVTVTAALRGQLALAAANAVGGIVAQTMFLALADLVYRRGALQRTAVSRKVLAELALVTGLLALVVVAFGAPRAVLGVHVVTPLLALAYLGGMVAVRQQPGAEEGPGEASSTDQPGSTHGGGADHRQRSAGQLWWRYAVMVVLLGGAGAGLSLAVGPLASAIGLDLAAAGAILTALATSTPELLTALSAARGGSLSLAVGDIAGGNAFDVLFLCAADIAALGALYGSLTRIHMLLAGTALLLNAVLLIGFVRRGRGVGGRVALESILVVVAYVAVAVTMVVA